VRCDGTSLLPYRAELLSVLRLTLHVVCKEVLTLSCVLLKHLLKALTLIYANEYCSTTMDLDQPLSQGLPIRVCSGSGSGGSSSSSMDLARGVLSSQEYTLISRRCHIKM